MNTESVDPALAQGSGSPFPEIWGYPSSPSKVKTEMLASESAFRVMGLTPDIELGDIWGLFTPLRVYDKFMLTDPLEGSCLHPKPLNRASLLPAPCPFSCEECQACRVSPVNISCLSDGKYTLISCLSLRIHAVRDRDQPDSRGQNWN